MLAKFGFIVATLLPIFFWEIPAAPREDHINGITWLAENENSTYFLSSFNTTWVGANKFCGDIGFGLINIESEDEHDFFMNIFSELPARIWIGGTDIFSQGTFVWSQTLEPFETFGYENWHNGEPSGANPNTGVEEDCVIFWTTNGTTKWNDVPCENSYGFICESLK